MTVKIYGESNDTIIITGDIEGEIVNPNTDQNNPGILIFNDGTILKIWYDLEGYWRILVQNKGDKFKFKQGCSKSNDDDYTDGVELSDGIINCYYSNNWTEFKSFDSPA